MHAIIVCLKCVSNLFKVIKQKQRNLEQQAIVQQAINRQSIQTAPWQQHLTQIQDTSQEQILQSEQNLAAQHQLLLQQQQVSVKLFSVFSYFTVLQLQFFVL